MGRKIKVPLGAGFRKKKSKIKNQITDWKAWQFRNI